MQQIDAETVHLNFNLARQSMDRAVQNMRNIMNELGDDDLMTKEVKDTEVMLQIIMRSADKLHHDFTVAQLDGCTD